MTEQKDIPVKKTEREYMIHIGGYAFKLSDIHFMRVDPLDPDDEESKRHIDNGADCQILVFTDHGTYLAALTNFQSAQIILDKVCDKINDLIATQKDL